MKKVIKRFCLIVLIMSAFVAKIDAACENDDLNDWIEKVDIKFVKITDDWLKDNNYTDEEVPYSYLLMFSLPRNDLKVTAKDSYSGGLYNVDYDEDFKNYVIGSEVHFIDKEYTFNIYMSDTASECSGELMRTITYTVPKYNNYNDTVYCEENPDASICGAYTKIDDENKDKIDSLVDRYSKDKLDDEILKSAPWYEKVWIIIKEYALYVIIPLAVLSLGYSIAIYIAKKRREKE